MALDAAGVALFNGIFQRVIARVLAAGARQVAGPGLIAGLVEGVTHRAHLQEDSIEVLRLELVQVGVELILLGGSIIDSRGPVDAIDRGDPCGAHFALYGLIGCRCDACCHSNCNEK